MWSRAGRRRKKALEGSGGGERGGFRKRVYELGVAFWYVTNSGEGP